AGGATERVDLDARVVGQGELAGGGRQRPGLEEGVLLERVAGLVRARVPPLDVPAVAEDLLHLRHLVGVAGGEQDVPHALGRTGRKAGGSATISRCSSTSSAMPFSPRASMASSSPRVKVARSAVPCTS